jgi:hypothetical protein
MIKSLLAQFYILVTIFIFITIIILCYARIDFRNMTWNRFYVTTILISINDVIKTKIQPNESWKIQIKDFIYIYMSKINFWFLFQSHSFMISWWNENLKNQNKRIHLLLKSRLKFIKRLMRHVQTFQLKTWIDEFYKEDINFESIDRAMLFANEIEIAAQILFIKKFLKNVEHYRVCTKKKIFIWQLNKENKFHFFSIVIKCLIFRWSR